MHGRERAISLTYRYAIWLATLAVGAFGRCGRADFAIDRPVNVGPAVNSPFAEGFDCLASDGLELYFDSDRPGGLGGWDIWVARRGAVDQDWSEPVNLGPVINTERDDSYASLSRDGLELYLTCDNRPGGYGGSDIWVANRKSPTDPWGPPENLGSQVNSPAPEGMPWISADGLELYFSAFGRPGGYGGSDLWVTQRATKTDDWGPPVNLGPQVNSLYSETEPSLSPDGRLLLFSDAGGARPGGYGSGDLWCSRRRTPQAAWDRPVNLGPVINTPYLENSPRVSFDGSMLHFGSDRPEGIGDGLADLWFAAVIPLIDLNLDGVVNEADIARVAQHWGEDEPGCDMAPTPWGDGVVDREDLAAVIRHVGEPARDPTLVAHWPLDETQGVVAFDLAGSHDATMHGDPVRQADGAVAGALELDGVEDYGSTGFVLDPSQGAFCVLAWVKGGAPGQVILSQADGADWLGISENAGTLATGLKPGLPGGPLLSRTDVADGQWHRIGLSWERFNRVLLVDGREVASDSPSAVAPCTTGLFIGAGSRLTAGSFFCGLIDDVRIYGRAVRPWRSDSIGAESLNSAAGPDGVSARLSAATVFRPHPYGGGCGTSDDPYQIWTAEQMNAIGAEPNDWHRHFRLMTDIDLSAFDGREGRPSFRIIAPDTDRTEGFQGTPFTGVFDGGGHTVSHLTIPGEGYLGFFGTLASGAAVRDLGLVDVDVVGSGAFVGGLAGFNYRGYVVGCFCTGTVQGGRNVGLLIGGNDGAVAQCYSLGAVLGNRNVGGLAGLYPDNHTYSEITHCYSAAVVQGDEDAGGLVGGGYGVATRCFWDTRASGRFTSATGTGRTTLQMQDIRTYANAGWDFAGRDEDGTSQIWQMPQAGGYPVLTIFHGFAAPRLQGRGTPADPYLVANGADLGAMIHYSPRDHYRLAASIDLVDVCWSTAVIPWFSGTFDGGGHTISHLTIRGAHHLGLFGRLLPGAHVGDLGVADVNLPGEGDYIGGLVGWNAGTVAACCARGSVSGDSSVGVLAGANGECLWYGRGWSCLSGMISNSYAQGWARADYDVGGLAGCNLGAVLHCYSTAAVSSPSSPTAGGLIGVDSLCAYDQGTSCHQGAATGCLWNVETSGQTRSAGGEGTATADMQAARTFLEAGWDFVGEMANGMDDVWYIEEGRDYPHLWWESSRQDKPNP